MTPVIIDQRTRPDQTAITATQRTAHTAEYRVSPHASIDLYVDGEPLRSIPHRAQIPPLPTQELLRAVLAELNAARRLGALHGLCGQHRGSAAHPVPGCVRHTVFRDVQYGRIRRIVDGRDTALFPDILIRPAYLEDMITNELNRAFHVGGDYGFRS
jgi:hypothetical protein